MASTYAIKEKVNEYGLVALTAGVFETITAITLAESDQISAADYSHFSRPIVCKVKDNLINLAIDIKIKRGIKVNETVEQLQERIYNTIFQMTDLKVNRIDIRVVGFLV